MHVQVQQPAHAYFYAQCTDWVIMREEKDVDERRA